MTKIHLRLFAAIWCQSKRISHIAIFVLVVLNCVSTARAYTADSPQVLSMIAKGVKYIEEGNGAGRFSDGMGAICLRGLVLYKYGHYIKHDPEAAKHPMVQEALQLATKEAARGANVGRDGKTGVYEKSLYHMTLACILLCEVDAERYRSEIQTMLNAMYGRQQASGGWTYINYSSSGDTSQTQYVILALWTAHSKGIRARGPVVAKALNWLMRTQDADGGWGYQGKDPGNYQLVEQKEKNHSLMAGGMGSVYICADLLGIGQKPEKPKSNSKRPSALRKKGEIKAAKPLFESQSLVDMNQLKKCLDLGNKKWASDTKIPKPTDLSWTYYYLYALERYQSFREKLEKSNVEEPKWFNQGVDYLKGSQRKDGGWTGTFMGRDLQTSLVCLFLIRSTKKTIQEMVEGVLLGGYGLPKDVSDVKRQGGQIVDPNQLEAADQILDIIEQVGNIEVKTAEVYPDVLELSDEPKERQAQLTRLRRLITAKNYQARRMATKTLSQVGDFDNVPYLIYALTDPDKAVQSYARTGLRRTSRKFKGFGLPDDPTEEELELAVGKWKNWFRSIKPDVVYFE